MSKLPGGWEQARLEDCAVLNPRHQSIASNTTVSFVPMPAVSETNGEIEGAQDRPFSEISRGYTHFQTGDVIFAKITPCMENGKIAVAKTLTNGFACGSTEFHVVRPLGDISPDFIWRFLRQKSFRADAERAMTGAVGQRRVPLDYLKTRTLPLPPPNEQRRIVAKIDGLFSKSRRAREHLDHTPRLVEKYKQAILSAAFSGGLTQKWRSASKGRLKPWSECSLGKIAEVGTGSTPKRGERRFYAGGKIPWVTSGAVNAPVVQSAQELITEAAIRETNCKVFPAGTLLMAMYGEGQTRGRVAVLGINAATNQAIAAIQVKDGGPVVRDFLLWYLRSTYLELRQRAAGGVQPNLNLGIIKALQLPLPSQAEQHEVVRLIEVAFSWIDRLVLETTNSRKLIDHLDQRILAKAFRGELVPQDPNDEPASGLLARVKAERAIGGSKKTKNRTAAA